MRQRIRRREAVLDRLADHILAHGLAGANLRALAASAGTSDRMLLYYFKDKDDLLATVLGHLAARVMQLLDRSLALGERLGANTLQSILAQAVRSANMRPFMRVWLELAAGASVAQEPHRAIAGQIADGFIAWLEDHLDVPAPAARSAQAAQILAMIEGIALLDALGRPELAEAAARAVECG